MNHKNFINLREIIELTQDEMAILFGVDSSTIHRWEKGICVPEKNRLVYFYAIDQIINNGDLEELKKRMKKNLIIGGHLATVYTLLKLYFEPTS